uniref:FLYWCH-type domain-containing protein n=1 Tax=Trichogramma kaykai TaxID=54128 RepID=A0ABD2WRJ9_9HYME
MEIVKLALVKDGRYTLCFLDGFLYNKKKLRYGKTKWVCLDEGICPAYFTTFQNAEGETVLIHAKSELIHCHDPQPETALFSKSGKMIIRGCVETHRWWINTLLELFTVARFGIPFVRLE